MKEQAWRVQREVTWQQRGGDFMNGKLREICRRGINARQGRLVALIATAVLGGYLAVFFLGDTRISVEGLTVRAAVVPAAQGATVFDLPPFGQVWAETHQAPLCLKIGLEEVSLAAFTDQWLNKDSREQSIMTVRGRMPELLLKFALRQVGLAFAGGAVLLFLLWRPRLRTVLWGGAGSAFLAVSMLTGMGLTYNLDAFREPHFTGAIAMAPGALQLVDGSLDQLEAIKDHTGQVVGNIKALFANIDSLEVLGSPDREEETCTVLLVSDLHSNPIGVEFMKTLAHQFRVALIVDAGDITDYGSPLEAEMISDIKEIGVPYVFLPGNHDTPEIIGILSGLENCTVLTGQALEIGGLRLLGIPDPFSQKGAVETKDPQERERLLDAYTDSVTEALQEQGRPDILVVHNQEVGKRLRGEASLVVAGHKHQLALRTGNDGVLINPGTTGAAGLRGFYSEDDALYSAVIVYLSPGQGPKAADIIRYDPMSAQFSLDRQLLGSDGKG
jgi:Icc-related predicted phosphoesterase